MVGNDIIDIEATKLQTNWQRKGFLQKIFVKEEQAYIHAAPDPFQMVWRMWSMKESAYKIYIQLGNQRAYSPSKFVCSPSSQMKGTVQMENYLFKTNTLSNVNYIFSSAQLSASDDVENVLFKYVSSGPKEQSSYIHRMTKMHVAKKYLLNDENLEIVKKKNNVPVIYHEDTLLDVSFSLSHHGDYGAISIIDNFNPSI